MPGLFRISKIKRLAWYSDNIVVINFISLEFIGFDSSHVRYTSSSCECDKGAPSG